MDVAEALEADAQELGKRPGTIIRELLEGRYGARSRAGKEHGRAGKLGSRNADGGAEIRELADA